MNCAWCGSNADSTGSHGICTDCAARILQQQVERHKQKKKSRK